MVSKGGYNYKTENCKRLCASEIVVGMAFKNVADNDYGEQFLVSRLKESDVLVPELWLVSEITEEVVGHIMIIKHPCLECGKYGLYESERSMFCGIVYLN